MATLHNLGVAMCDYLLNKLPEQVHLKDYTPHESGGKEYDVKSDGLALDKANTASVDPTEPHGLQDYVITLTSPVKVTCAPEDEDPHTVSVSEVTVQLGDLTTDGQTLLIGLDDPLVRAGWSYFLLHGDGSEGVHNPSFTMDVIRASIAALR